MSHSEYWLDKHLIYGPNGYTGDFLDGEYVHGPRGYTQHWISEDQIYGPAGYTGCWISEDQICGPKEGLPWMQVRSWGIHRDADRSGSPGKPQPRGGISTNRTYSVFRW